MENKIVLCLLAILIFSVQLSIADLSASQTTAYEQVTNTDLKQVPELSGLSDTEVVQLLRDQQKDDKYSTFVSRISAKDFQRALREDPSLVSRNKNPALMARLDQDIAKDPLWINKGFWGDNSEIKANWLKAKGFNDGQGYSWDGVEISKFDASSGLLTLETGDGKTSVDTASVAGACIDQDKETCVTLTDGGKLRTAEGIEISGFSAKVESKDGQMSYTLTKQDGGVPQVDLNGFDSKTPANIIVDNVPSTEIVDTDGFNRVIARDTSFNLKTLGSGGVSIEATSDTPVEIFANVEGFTGDRKLFELGRGEGALIDYQENVFHLGRTSNTPVFDSEGNKLFTSSFSPDSIITTRDLEDISPKYLKGLAVRIGAVLDDDGIKSALREDIVSIKDGILSGANVYVKPSYTGSLTLKEFQNGVYFESDTRAGGRIYQEIAGTDLEITHDKTGVKFTAGTPGMFRGVSKSTYGPGKNDVSRVIFDNNLIFSDTVKQQQMVETPSGHYVYKTASRYEVIEPTTDSTTEPVTVDVSEVPKTIVAQKDAMIARIDTLSGSSSEKDVQGMMDTINQLAELAGGFYAGDAKQKCTGDKLKWDQDANNGKGKCVPKTQ